MSTTYLQNSSSSPPCWLFQVLLELQKSPIPSNTVCRSHGEEEEEESRRKRTTRSTLERNSSHQLLSSSNSTSSWCSWRWWRSALPSVSCLDSSSSSSPSPSSSTTLTDGDFFFDKAILSWEEEILMAAAAAAAVVVVVLAASSVPWRPLRLDLSRRSRTSNSAQIIILTKPTVSNLSLPSISRVAEERERERGVLSYLPSISRTSRSLWLCCKEEGSCSSVLTGLLGMLRLFAVLIRGPSHWSLLPTHLVVVVAALVEVVILQNSRTSEPFFFRKQVYEKHTRSCGKNLQETNADRIQELRRKTNVGSSEWRDQLAKNAKNKQAKKQLFPIEERRRRRRRSRSEEICSNSSDQNWSSSCK